jgi:glycosyltransferase involved in cell wall biosynthesis
LETIFLIVPCYNEAEVLPQFYLEIQRVAESLHGYQLECVFVDDGSKDQTVSILKSLAQEDSRMRYLSLSRNFGKEAALYAGLVYSRGRGDYFAILDADLQDPPSLLPEMLNIIKSEGYDCVATRRINRTGEPPIRSWFAKAFYKIMNILSKTEVVDGARDFRLMTKSVVEAIVQIQEYNRFTKGIYGWIGFKTKWISYENIERAAGVTKWSFWKLFLYSMDGILAFSTLPLAIASIIGLIFFLISIFGFLVIVIKTIIWGDPVTGFPALASLITLIGGIHLFCLGIIGQYLAKTYLETKKRPIFLIREASPDIPTTSE